jgi:hypothetical protein
MSWLFVLNPNLTDAQVADLIAQKRAHQERMAAAVQAGCDKIMAADGLSAEGKAKALGNYISAVGALVFL